ncbi:hypothetical protein Tco_0641606 [Tanacetum coccineum]
MENKLGEATPKARDEKNAYIELVDMSIRALIKEEVNTQLPQILPQAVSDFANPVDMRIMDHRLSRIVAQAEEPIPTIEDLRHQYNQSFHARGDNDEQPADKEVTKADWFKKPERPPTPDPDWKYHLEECSKATTKRLDWHNPENKPYPFDIKKPLPLIQDHQGRQIIPQDYFINKDLEYLKGGDLSEIGSTCLLGHFILGSKRPKIYGLMQALTLSKDVYSRRRIIAVTRLKIMKMYDYGHLEEIEVCRDDQKLYTFKEGYRQVALSNEVDAESREVCWWKNWRDLPRDIPLDSVVVPRYEKQSKSENKGRVPTEMELVLEQTQQGTSYEVSVSTKGVEELKRKVKIKGEKKENPPYT